MSKGGDESQQQQPPQTPQQNINVSIQDILGDDNNPLAVSGEASFQSFMAANENGSQAAYDRLPAELQHFFSSNGSEDLLDATSSSTTASLLSQQHVNDILWKDQKDPTSTSGVPSLMPTSAPASQPQPSWIMPATNTTQSTPPPQTMPIPVQSAPATASGSAPAGVSPQAASQMTLLDNITSALSPERKERFISLFKELQGNAVSADEFLNRAKLLLGNQEYKQLEDLRGGKNRKGGQQRTEDAQRAATMTGIIAPQMKRPKTDHPPATAMPMGPPMTTTMPMFKTPNMPNVAANLQIPRPNASQAPSSTPKPAPSSSAPGTAGDRIDYDTITDVMGYAGVDLKEEAEHFLRDGEMNTGSLPDGIDRTKLQDFLNADMLRERLLKSIKQLSIANMDPDYLSYLALATQYRLRGLIEQMVQASKHRILSQNPGAPPPTDENGHPLYKVVVQQDVKKQLLAVERAEREEERKRKEAIAERERRANMGDGEGGPGDEDRPKKKKKDKEMGPGVSARNMSEDMRKRHTNETALMSAGGVRKSWMLAAGNKEKQPFPNPPSAPGTPMAASPGSNTSTPADEEGAPRGRGRPRGRKAGEGKRGVMGGAGRGRGRQVDAGLFLPPSTIGRGGRLGELGARRVTVRDAVFALERDCEMPGRAGSQRTLLKTYSQRM